MKLREIINKIPISIGPVKMKSASDNMETSYEDMSEEEFQLLMATTTDSATITVEVVYVTETEQIILEAQVPRGATIEDGIVLSGLLDQCEDVDLSVNKVGLYGFIKPLSEVLSDGDRIEIYRPVTAKE